MADYIISGSAVSTGSFGRGFFGANVGIGTTNTRGRRLTIEAAADTSNDQILYLKQTPDDYGWSFNIAGGTTGTLHIKNVASGTESDVLLLKQDGKVGIGGVPTQKFDVSNGHISLDQGYALYLDGGSNTYITSDGADKITLATGGANRVTIDSGGRVGIGTTGPESLAGSSLHIRQSSTDASINLDDKGHYHLILQNNDGSAATGRHVGIFMQINSNSQAADASIYTEFEENGGAKLHFTTTKSGTGQERMVIDSDGNVGIGTTGPDGSLHVHTATAGTMTAHVSADDLVVENSDHGGISILTPNNKTGAIYFGDVEDNNIGALHYNHSLNKLVLTVAAADRFSLSANTAEFASTITKISGSSTSTGSFGSVRVREKYELAEHGDVFTIKDITNSRTLFSLTTGAVITIGQNYNANINLNTSAGVVIPNGTGLNVQSGNISGSATSTGSFGRIYAGGNIVFNGASNKIYTYHLNNANYIDAKNFQANTSSDINFQNAVGPANITSVGNVVRLKSKGTTPLVASGSFIGIGTESPKQKLEVSPGSRSSTFSASDSDTWADIILRNLHGNQNTATGIAFQNNGTYHTNASTGIAAVKAVDNGDYPTDLVFITRPDGAVAAERLRITHDGKVGIGTTSPSNKLTVEDTIGIKRSGVNATTTLQMAGSGLIVNGASGYHPLIIQGNGTEFARVNSSGNVGIGTTSPSAKLHVIGDTIVTGNITAKQLIVSSSVTNMTVAQASGSTKFGDTVSLDTHQFSGSLSVSGSITLNGSAVSAGGGGSSVWSTNGNKIYYNTDNVGIGTTNPGTKLHINGGDWNTSLRIQGSGGASGINFMDSDGNTDGSVYAISSMVGFLDPTGNWMIRAQYNNHISFATTNATELMRINSSGNVGINNTTPQRKLDVNNGGTGISAHFGGYTSTTNGVIGGISFGYFEAGNVLYRKAGIIQEQIGDSSARGHLHLLVDTAADNGSANASDAKLTIHGTSGNVGIGNTSPTQKLQVDGNILLTTAGTHKLMFTNSAVQIDRTGGHLMRFEAFAGYSFKVNGSEKMSMNSSGDVGIGATSPAGKLDVRGTVTASMFHANASSDAGSPEYSFGTDPDTGMYWGGANVLAFSTAGAVRFTLNSGAFSSQTTGGARITPTNGSAAAATFTFNDDTDTGMFRGAANQLGFTTGGTEKVRIVGTGEVGIGTASPGGLLHAYGANNSAGVMWTAVGVGNCPHIVLQNGGTTSNNNAGYFFKDNDGYVGGVGMRFTDHSPNKSKLIFSTANTNTREIGAFNESGSLGVGTTTPEDYFYTANQLVVKDYYDGQHAGITIVAGSSYRSRIHFGDGTGAASYRGWILYDHPDDEFLFGTAATTRMVIDSSGNVGIGTISPAKPFHLYGGGENQVARFESSDQYAGIELKDSTSATLPPLISALGNDFRIYGGHASARPTIMTLLSTGNVGIGVTNPTSKLQVNGSFSATSKSFLIDHPTKEGKKLQYGSLEGPENGVYVRGKFQGGKYQDNIIDLPDYWVGLVDEDTITINLTPVGKYQQLYVEDIKDNQVFIKSADDSEIKCFYTIYGERKDIEKLEVEF